MHIRPFTDDDVAGAAALLAERHARHRAAEPLLPEVADFRAQVERDWRRDDASGAVALRDGSVVGYVIGRVEKYGNAGANWILVDLAGHAVAEPELVRDLYAAAAEMWVAAGITRHGVFVPSSDTALVDAWFRLAFGAQAALAVRETSPGPSVEAPVEIRAGVPADLDSAAGFDRLLYEHQLGPPSFSGSTLPTDEFFRDDWSDTWDDPQFVHFVAERAGRVVGHVLLYERPPGDLRVPERSIDLAHAATNPDVRGSGIGLALTAHVLRWAHANGYRAMTTDWRMVNLLSSRFWPRRGFRPTFLRLYRSIP
jgi:ribosomal protein S18 acetylase RimI-like enzyme